MGQTKPDATQPIAGDQSDVRIAKVGNDPHAIQCVANPNAEVLREIRVNSAPGSVFALLTNARQMMNWLARDVKADPRPGGIFRLADFSGLWVEGTYLKVIRDQLVVFSWGGIEGLKIGQSTVEFSLHPESNSTLVRLHHFGLSDAAVDLHCLCWENWGLPKLKAAAEGREPGASYSSEVADWREQHAYAARVSPRPQSKRCGR
jgi:uncharacterized protein YndB with AHSA1/START domain